ncbi:SusC/RagA family TonB-linked outer membrane protein [Sanguibacteroides justesenii]|nr:SusC/RagA family TonB-linked outer membrane protein [Sanguibacteroides justesenii]
MNDKFMKKKLPDRWKLPAKWKKTILVMKMSLILMVWLTISTSAAVYSQHETVTLDVKSSTLIEVLTRIKDQTGVRILYNVSGLRGVTCKDIVLKDVPVEDALRRVLSGTAFGYEQIEGVFVIKAVVKDEKKSVTIRGWVRDKKEEFLPGVTVRLLGTSLGTSTDTKGWFAITLPVLKGTLEFSFIGYKKQKVDFTEKTDTLRVVMEEDVAALEEVVVRAYGTQNKREVIGAISSVKAEEMKELPTASIVNMLQGRLAGVNIIQQSGAPGSASVIAVRGFNSLLVDGASDGQPLWVVDGVPMHSFVSPVTGTNTLADLDPAMIESVEVLKDAAAASIYGSRAGNGVILITTKKGKAGTTKFAANISYSVSQVQEYPLQIGGRMERWFRNQVMRNRLATGYDWNKQLTYYPSSYESVYLSGGTYDGWWVDGRPDLLGNPVLQDSLNPFYNNSTNWWKHIFRTAKVVNANLQVSGGSERFQYMIGAGWYDEKGIMLNSDYSRANMLINLQTQPTKKIRVDARVMLSYVDRSISRDDGMGGTRRYEGITVDPSKQSTTLPNDGLAEDELLKNINLQRDRTDDYRAMASMSVQYNAWKGITLSASGSVDYAQGNKNQFKPSVLNPDEKENMSDGSIGRAVRLETEELLHWRESINEAHNFDLLIGLNVNKEQQFLIAGFGKRGPSDKIYYYSPPYNPIFNYGTETNPDWRATTSYNSDFREKTMVSYFGRLGYNYKQRYLVEIGFRRDGSSTFGENHRWANFPSFALGWAFSEEPFMRWAYWLNWGKLRGSYGTSGQIFTSEYMAYGLFVAGASFNGNPSVIQSKPVSPNLTWEKSSQYNIGLDLDMFDYRLSVKMDYYFKYTSSLLYKVRLPGTLWGAEDRDENAMEVSNEGIELELLAHILRSSKLGWRMKLNVSRDWSRLEKTYTGKDIGGGYNGFVIGRPLGSIYAFNDTGYYQNEGEVPVYTDIKGNKLFLGGVGAFTGVSGLLGTQRISDASGDYDIQPKDMYYLGSALPLVYGGWVNELTYKDFDLNILFNYSLGRKMINMRNASLSGTDGPVFADVRKLTFWQKEGDQTDMPAIGRPYYPQVRSKIERVNLLSLKQLTIGYNMPKKVMEKIGFSGARFFATGENLFYWSNYSGGNPEVVDVYSGLDGGMAYPLPRKWTLGLTLNF